MSRARLLIVVLTMSGCGVERDLGGRDANGAAVDSPRAAGACTVPCGTTEVCHRGACIPRSPGGEPCSDVNATRLGAEDGCAPDAVCTAREADAGARCLTYPPCAANDTCPVGTVGGTCNTGYVATKARICLPGECIVPTDCPASQRCLKAIGELGSCSAGDPGSPCVVTADCKNTHCFTPGGGYGICF